MAMTPPPPATPAGDTQACLLKLAPHLLGRSRRGVVGSSRYADRLRDAVRSAAADPQAGPVLISGEPGLEKDNIAALIHFGSPRRRRLMARIDAATLGDDGAPLFGSGSSGGVGSLLDCLGDGALLIDNLDRADPALLPQLLELARSGRWRAPGEGSPERQYTGRVFFSTESALPQADRCCTLIRVPPLRVRRQDLGEWLRYGIRQQAPRLGWQRPPAVSEAVVKRLQSHDFPGNIRELNAVVERALRQAAADHPAQLPDDVFWTGSRVSRLRFDLFRWRPRLRQWLRAPALWNLLLFGLVSWVFVLVNLWLWLGPQERAHNGALNLFWAWWWPLILLAYPLVGRAWCATAGRPPPWPGASRRSCSGRSCAIWRTPPG